MKPWDIAAGVLLVREAGGRVTDFRGAGTGPMDQRGIVGRPARRRQPQDQRALQKAIVSSGYAAAF